MMRTWNRPSSQGRPAHVLPRGLALLLSALALGGCDAPGPTTRPTTGPDDARPLTPGYSYGGRPLAPGDARSAVAGTVHLDVYLLDVPSGTISHDEAFWRTVDENAVGAAADQRLLASGIRCGVAPRNQWPHFAEIFARDLGRARRTKVDGLTRETVELEVDQPVEREDIWFVNADDQWEGRSYARATNGIALTFAATPREPGSVRLSLCPIVKRDRRRLEYTQRNQAYESPVTDVDRIYDVGLTVDVPADGFLIVAPGPLATPNDLTLGGRFLIRRDPAALREQVIVAVPSFVPLNGHTVAVLGR